MSYSKKRKWIVSGLITALLSLLAIVPNAWSKPFYTANAMAPLYVEESEMGNFHEQLRRAKEIGVEAISVDVWWGLVEGAGDQQFDWSYYDRVFGAIEQEGLHIVAIMSFHQCGGNVGDDCFFPLPSWIWNRYQGVNPGDLKYKSEQGNESTEFVSLWSDDLVSHQYVEFMNAFEDKYANKAHLFDELNISCGPAGELRYPSYNSHDQGTGYPTRGAFQAYSDKAKQDFRDYAVAKYGDLNGINQAWGFGLGSVNDINPPGNASTFMTQQDYINMQYGRDFVDWYNESLKQHGIRMVNSGIQAFDGALADVPLGIKLPGIHWQMGNSAHPRAAEVAAGLIQTSVDFNNASTGHGYENIVSAVTNFKNSGREVILHFTALEMDNQADYNVNSPYSQAKDLVFWMANEAERQGIDIKGENALAGGVATHQGWDNIENAIEWAAYTGLTVLRVGNIGWDIGRDRYANLIATKLEADPVDPTEPPTGGDWQRTVIFMYGQTVSGQDMFLRGGLDHTYANTVLGRNCETTNFECAMPIRHLNLRNGNTTPWKTGENYLDWYGQEATQTSQSHGTTAQGTPLDWTTNIWPPEWGAKKTVAVDGFGEEPLNLWGQHYWMLDVEMDCSKSADGWFELKAFIAESGSQTWEANINQANTPYGSNNHFAQCGMINMFRMGENTAEFIPFQ